MHNGFSLLELLIALALGVSLLSIVIINTSQSATLSKRINHKQETLEAIFHTVDTIKSDLTKCGMRLQEAGGRFGLNLFRCSGDRFSFMLGAGSEMILETALAGEKQLAMNRNDYFRKNKEILIYSREGQVFEFNRISGWNGGRLELIQPLQNGYAPHSPIVVVKTIEYKFFPKQQCLKRKVDRGHFQPLIENVTDFYVNFFSESNSVLYRLEVNAKEQVRGYIFLVNMV